MITLIEHGWVVPVDGSQAQIEAGAVTIAGDRRARQGHPARRAPSASWTRPERSRWRPGGRPHPPAGARGRIDITDVFVNGRQVIADRRSALVDWREARRERHAAAERVWRRAAPLFGD